MKYFYSYLLFISLFFCTACHTRKQTDELLRVALLRGPSAIAFAGWMEEAPVIDGKAVEISIIDSPELMHAILLQNRAEIAILPMINAANLYSKAIDYELAGCPVWGNLYLVEAIDVLEDAPLYIFGAHTTPDILTRYYCESEDVSYSHNYSFGTVGEIVQGIYAGRVKRAVLGEPYLSMVMQQEPDMQIVADLNHPGERTDGFAQTAILRHSSLQHIQVELDSLFASSCQYVRDYPLEAIRNVEEEKIFPVGSLTSESIERCRIAYVPAKEAKESIRSFLELIYWYEPKALGGKLPDDNFYN